MIHSGAIVGAGVPQLRSMFFKFVNFPYRYFRSDREKRDFVSSGAAAGVAGTLYMYNVHVYVHVHMYVEIDKLHLYMYIQTYMYNVLSYMCSYCTCTCYIYVHACTRTCTCTCTCTMYVCGTFLLLVLFSFLLCT